MTVLIDSWAWLEYFRGSAAGRRVRPYVDGDEDVVASAINVAEVYRRILADRDEPTAEDYRRVLATRATIVPLDEALAVQAARIKVAHKLGMADAIVLATARALDARVVSGDPDFKPFGDVVYVGP